MKQEIYRTMEAVLGDEQDRSRLGNLIFGILRFAHLIPEKPPKKPITPGL